jgi:hypothetical protein
MYIWGHGEEVLYARVEGKVTTSHALFHDYNLKLDYLTRKLQRQRCQVEFMRFFIEKKNESA